MIKKSLYPKTQRINDKDSRYIVTEKLDGSNLGLFKLNGLIYIAQRNYIFSYEEIEEEKCRLYGGLYDWLKENGEHLQVVLIEKSCIFGEWVSMGKIKYGFEDNFFMFAKANVDEEFNIKNIYYDRDLFIYSFREHKVPEYIKFVPVVATLEQKPNIERLDRLYDVYKKDTDRNVEGFILIDGNNIKKYVRMKNGKLEPHRP